MTKNLPGEIIVTFAFNHTHSREDADNIVQNLGLSIKNRIGKSHTYVIAVPEGKELYWVELFKNSLLVKSANLHTIKTAG